MSHFTVFAATKSPSEDELYEIMRPYNEYECTGDTMYCRHIDITQESIDDLEEHNRSNPDDQLTAEDWMDYEYDIDSNYIFDTELENKPDHRYAVVNSGKIIAVYNYTNPNSKWDYYTPQSWSKKTYIKHIVAEDGKIILKKDFDIDTYMDIRKQNYINTYRTIRPCIDPDFKTWETCKVENQNIDDARKIYNSQQSLDNIKKKLGESEYFSLCFDNTIDEIAMQTEEEFVKNSLDSTAPFWAIVTPESEWIEKGKMGWWAMSSDEDNNWKQTWRNAWDKISGDCYLWIIDCHI